MRKLIIIATVLSVLTLMLVGCGSKEITEWEKYTVQKGDTLWHIAKYSDLYNGENARYIIELMTAKNNIIGMIQPGMVLLVPMCG